MLDHTNESLKRVFKYRDKQELLNKYHELLDKYFSQADVMSKKFSSIGDKMTSLGRTMTMGVSTPITLGLGAALKTSADFEGQMSRVGAIAQASSKDLKSMSNQAVDLGAKTSKSANEVAKGMEELAALGFNAKQTMEAMPGVISAAEASGAEMATTATVMASAINSFGLKASDANHVADLLARSANDSAADIQYMGDALKYAGTPAKALGVSIEDTSAAIEVLSNSGLEGSQAGTALRASFIRLANPSKSTAKEMKKLGIHLSDAKGQFDEMKEEWEKAKRTPAERGDFITKRFNIFANNDEMSFIDYPTLQKNNEIISLDELEGRPCTIGYDLSETEDFTAACATFALDNGKVAVLTHSWIPKHKVEYSNEKIPYREWEEDGLLTIQDKPYIDYQDVLNWIIKMNEHYVVEKITYDRANAFKLNQELKNYGFETEETRQGALTLSPALKDLKEMFLDGKIIFNNNPLMKWYINNVQLKLDRNGNWLPSKQSRYRKIDGPRY
ncbi:terminase large subunit [Staphylococcus phage 1PHSA12]|nr:terminase large subunit [Staphylococcus phage 1PHSA12]